MPLPEIIPVPARAEKLPEEVPVPPSVIVPLSPMLPLACCRISGSLKVKVVALIRPVPSLRPMVMFENPLVKLLLKAVAGICSVPAPLPTPMVVLVVSGAMDSVPELCSVPATDSVSAVTLMLLLDVVTLVPVL